MSVTEILLIVSMVINIIFTIMLFYVNETWYKELCDLNDGWSKLTNEMNKSWSNFYKSKLKPEARIFTVDESHKKGE